MSRFKLTLEYAGTRYSGWQRQQNAKTVAGEVETAIRAVTGRRDFELYGSGRTDAGVHALAQVAHLDVVTALPGETLRRRLNDALPSDINVLRAEAASRRFHARHDAVRRSYLYQIARRRTAFAKAFVWWVKDPLDLACMRAAARPFVGMRNFRAFAATGAGDQSPEDRDGDGAGAGRSTLVLIDRLDIAEEGDLVLIRIEGSHFLWKMVRRLVGVLVEVGRGQLEAADAARYLAPSASSAVPARLTAPPSGLFLARVDYTD